MLISILRVVRPGDEGVFTEPFGGRLHSWGLHRYSCWCFLTLPKDVCDWFGFVANVYVVLVLPLMCINFVWLVGHRFLASNQFNINSEKGQGNACPDRLLRLCPEKILEEPHPLLISDNSWLIQLFIAFFSDQQSCRKNQASNCQRTLLSTAWGYCLSNRRIARYFKYIFPDLFADRILPVDNSLKTRGAMT